MCSCTDVAGILGLLSPFLLFFLFLWEFNGDTFKRHLSELVTGKLYLHTYICRLIQIKKIDNAIITNFVTIYVASFSGEPLKIFNNFKGHPQANMPFVRFCHLYAIYNCIRVTIKPFGLKVCGALINSLWPPRSLSFFAWLLIIIIYYNC